MTGTYVLDANAVLDLADAGPGWQRVNQVLDDALLQRTEVLVSVLNWGEVYYCLWQQRGEEKARQTLARLSLLPLQLVPIDLLQALRAGEIKALHNIPYMDCVAAALAALHKAVLVTSDRDFEKLGRHAKILWIPRK
jgi:predicted nucleic acid-binding protein